MVTILRSSLRNGTLLPHPIKSLRTTTPSLSLFALSTRNISYSIIDPSSIYSSSLIGRKRHRTVVDNNNNYNYCSNNVTKRFFGDLSNTSTHGVRNNASYVQIDLPNRSVIALRYVFVEVRP